MTNLQHILIERIRLINDTQMLQEVKRLLDTLDGGEEVYQVSYEQRKAIEEAQREIAAGNFLTNEEASAQTREWLKNQ